MSMNKYSCKDSQTNIPLCIWAHSAKHKGGQGAEMAQIHTAAQTNRTYGGGMVMQRLLEPFVKCEKDHVS